MVNALFKIAIETFANYEIGKWSAEERTTHSFIVVGGEKQHTVREGLEALNANEGWPGCLVRIDFNL